MQALVSFFSDDVTARWMWWLGTAVLVAVLMEPWAAFAHRRLWHRPGLWRLHKSHHAKKRGWWEANDLLSAGHVPVSIAIIAVGVFAFGPVPAGDVLFGVGVGMAAFGISYFVFHDGMVHGRLPVAFLLRVPMCARWRDAHEEHHRRNAAPYGFFRGPTELARAQAQADPKR